jgi:hypothetical protein
MPSSPSGAAAAAEPAELVLGVATSLVQLGGFSLRSPPLARRRRVDDNAAMADEEKQKRGTPWLASWLFILLVVYPLSIGPANWLCNHLEMPQWVGDAAKVFYAPILLLYENFDWFERLLDWYASLWPD